jgi:transcriptional regulator with XRE-family HTH domain
MAQKIKELRQERGLTLEQVANVVGVGKSTVRKWETGMIANMRRDKIAALAQALGTTPAYLMGWEDEDEENPHELKLVTAFDKLSVDDQIIVSNWVEDYEKNPAPPITKLSEKEQALINLFRLVPEENRGMVLEKILVALNTQG